MFESVCMVFTGKSCSSIMYARIFKRIFDFCISLVALIILSPVMLVVALLLFFFNKGAGVFFVQERPGKDNKIFKVIKFKTMTDERDSEGNLLPDLLRITKVGRFIRNASLDELPQLFNVLKGDMSLIGPRPLLTQYLPLYSKEQMRRHDVRPGISGWAQVNGRNTISWGEKFKLDVWYVDHLSFSLDLKILFMTIIKVFRKDSINNLQAEREFTTMPDFDGSN